MRKLLFIINPIAGNGKGTEQIRIINQYMSKLDLEYAIKISNKVGNVTEMTAWGCQNNFTDIISVGGDGTFVEAVNGLDLKANVSLALIPSGTGNDFARVLNMPKDVKVCLDIIMVGDTKLVDIGTVNEQRFINVCCMGIDGEIILDTDRIKSKIKGTSAYILSTLKALSTYKAKKVVITIDGQELIREIILVAVGNGKYIGGGMKVTPDAEIDDGLLELCIVNKLNKGKLLMLFPSIFKGTHVNIKPTVEMYRGKEIHVHAIEDRLLINADGNIIGTTPAKIGINGNKIKIVHFNKK